MSTLSTLQLTFQSGESDEYVFTISEVQLLLGYLCDIYAIGAMDIPELEVALRESHLGALGYGIYLKEGFELRVSNVQMNSPITVGLTGLVKGITFLKRHLSIKMFVAKLKGIYEEWDNVNVDRESALLTQIQSQNLKDMLSIPTIQSLNIAAQQADERLIQLKRDLDAELLHRAIVYVRAMKRETIIRWELKEIANARYRKKVAIEAGAGPEEISKLNERIRSIAIAIPSPAYLTSRISDPNETLSRDQILINQSTVSLLTDSSEHTWGE